MTHARIHAGHTIKPSSCIRGLPGCRNQHCFVMRVFHTLDLKTQSKAPASP